MARVSISAENQIERLNRIASRLKEIETLSPKELVKQPTENKWSIAEVIEHMYIAYTLYTDKLNNAIAQSDTNNESWTELKAGRWVSLLLKNFRPKNGVIKMKMKTQKIFEPKRLPSNQSAETLGEVFKDMYKSIDHLKECAIQSRTKNCSRVKFSSAIGPVIRFNVPEAIEFILRHNERHMFQVELMLDSGYEGYFSNNAA